MTILLVDDDFFFQKTMSFYLQELKHEVVFASDGKKALDILEKRLDFDLVICDIDMPVLPGEIFVPAVKANYRGKMPVIMFISGKKNGQEFLKRSGIPYDYYFEKPMDIGEFSKAIEKIKHSLPDKN